MVAPKTSTSGEESLVAGGVQGGQPGGHHWKQHALVCTLAGLFCSDASSFPRVKELGDRELCSNPEVCLRCVLSMPAHRP